MSKKKITKFQSSESNRFRIIVLRAIFLLFIFFAGNISFAQWMPDLRLTIDSGVSFTSFNGAWCVAASGNSVHAVWHDSRDGNNEIYYKLSTDGGVSWGTDVRLTNNMAVSQVPSIAASGAIVHVTWQDHRDGNAETYYKRSTDNGVSWGVDTRLTNNFATSIDPSLMVSGSDVHIVWWDDRPGHYEIYYKRSSDGGLTWGADAKITDSSAFACRPSVSVSGQTVHVVWYDNPAGNFEIYYKRSTDGGINWGAKTRLTNDPAFSCGPSVSSSGSFVHVLWYETRDGNNEIYYKRSTDGGMSWGADTRLTNNDAVSRFPSAAASGTGVHIVWVDDRDGDNEVYAKRSTNGGISWETDVRLTNNSSLSQYPSVAIFGAAVHVVWNDDRNGNVEIYYKHNPTGNPVGIINSNMNVPGEFSLYQNYPNPFNPSTNIKFDLPESGNISLKVYDQMGREAKILSEGFKNAGTYEVNFDASELSSGVYFYKFVTDNISVTKKMLLVK